MPSADEFAGRVALVTGGAGAAIGGATCRTLASYGAAIAVVDSHQRRTDAMAAELSDTYGVETVGICADISDRPAMDAAVAEISETLGPVDILVNSAAINVQGSIFDYDPDDWDRVIDADLTAPWYLIRITIGAMRDRGSGSIINVTSVAAYIGGNGVEGPYGVAKAGLHDLTRAVAIEGGPFGIRCNAVAPGLIDSKWVQAQAERYETFIAETPLRRHGQPEDVANTIAFLCSHESAHITGAVINLSGGWYLTP